MSTEGRGDEPADSGQLSVMGHHLLSSAAVVAGGVATLRDADDAISAEERAVIGIQIIRSLEVIMEIAHSLVSGDVEALDMTRVPEYRRS